MNELGADLESLLQEARQYDNPLTEKQRDILHAAEQLFSSGGFTETSTAAIAKAAKVTEKTLFKHFPSKTDLLKRILFPLLLRIMVPIQFGMLKKVIEADYPSFQEFYRALAANRWNEVRQQGPKIRLVLARIIQDEQLRNQARELFLRHGWPLLEGKIRYYQKNGELRRDLDSEVLTRIVFLSIAAPAFQRGVLDPQKVFDDSQDLDIHTDILLNGIRVK